MSSQGWSNQTNRRLVVVEGSTYTGLFFYSPTAGLGNLVGSWTAQAGTDPYGNTYPAGLDVDAGSIIVSQPGQGVFVYNGTPSTGNLIVSLASQPGVDAYGNSYVQGIQVAPGAGLIDGSTLGAGTVIGDALAAQTITAGNIANEAITATQLANAAVGAGQLAAGAVYAGAIQTGAVTTNSIAANAIVAGLIAAGALDAFDINTGTLTVQGSQGQILVYNGTAANGTLFISLAPQPGIDNFGNSFPAGIAITNNGTITGADVIINPSQGALIGYSQ